MDFKENLKLNRGPIETGEMFYNAKQKTLLGIIIYFKKEQSIEKLHYNILSDILNHDSLFVYNAVKKLKEDLLWKFKHIQFWMDVGPHFKSKENLYNLLNMFNNVTLNYFCEKHGKSPCDSHFSTISKWLQEIIKYKHILTVDQLIEEFKRKKSKNRILWKKLNLENYSWHVKSRKSLRIRFQKEKEKIRKLICSHIKDYYLFKKLKENKVLIKVTYKSSKKKVKTIGFTSASVKRKIKFSPEYIFDNSELIKKNIKKRLLRQKNNN